MPEQPNPDGAIERWAARYWTPALALILILAAFLRWPYPEPTWTHVDEWVLVVFPLGFWSGDLNPHFFNYPTLHLYFTSAVYFLYYLIFGDGTATDFLTYRYFVDDADLIAIARGLGSIASAATVGVCAFIGKRLYGPSAGLLAALFTAVMLLPVRFAHLAITDNPALLWIALALLWAVRVVQEGRRSDCVVAGIFVGLATATKFPSAPIAIPVGLAALMVKPSRPAGLWHAAGAGAATFLLTTPYVVLDWTAAWSFVETMGRFHLFANQASPDEAAWLYHVRHNLRHGLGVAGLFFVAAGMIWRIHRIRADEIVLLSAAVPFFILLASAESVFMRYLLPLVPVLALFAVRFFALMRTHRTILGCSVFALLAEPAYASLYTRALLSSADTREQAASWISTNAAQASRLVNIPASFAKIQLPEPERVYVRQKHFIKSFDTEELIEAFDWLSRQPGLGSIYLQLSAAAVQEDLASDWESAKGKILVVEYQHPLLAPATKDSGAEEGVRALTRWRVGFSAGHLQAVPFDFVDWHFVPLGRFQTSSRTGPQIRIGELPVKHEVGRIRREHLFAAVRGILKANVAMQQEHWERAIGIYEDLQDLSVPLDEALTMDYLYDYYFNLGLAHHNLGRFDQAVDFWEQNVRLQPQTARPYNNLAAAYFRLGDLTRAVEAWERAIALDPEYPEAYFNLGNALFNQQQYGEAANAWKKAIELKPDYGQAHYGLGNIHFQMGAWDRALAAYDRALRLSPGEANIHYNIALTQMRRGRPDAAIKSYERVVELRPKDAEALLELGKLYAQAGNGENARRSLERVLAVAPNHPQAAEIRRALEAR